MIADPKNKSTTNRWEEHAEKALARPLALTASEWCRWFCSKKQGPAQKVHQQTAELLRRLPALAQKCLRRQASEVGGTSQKKWLIWFEWQKRKEKNPARLPYVHWDSTGPGAHRQLEARLWGHEQGIVQGVTDGPAAVRGHHRQEGALRSCQYKEEARLGSTGQHRNAPVLSPEVHQDPRETDGHVTDFQGGKICQEKNAWVSAVQGQA